MAERAGHVFNQSMIFLQEEADGHDPRLQIRQ
jgi:hypothetical protein